MEKLFKTDRVSKRKRVERALNHQPVDRVPIHEQLSYNTGVISLYTGKSFPEFGFTPEDVGFVIQKTLDSCFPIIEDKGEDTYTDPEGFTFRNEHWMTWRIGRPFADEHGAAEWLTTKVRGMEKTGLNTHTAVSVESGDNRSSRKQQFNADTVRREYRNYMLDLQKLVGETVIIDFSFTGFCDLFDAMGLEIFTFFSLDYPDLFQEYMDVSIANEIRRVETVADPELSPVVLSFHYPYVKMLTETWHRRDLQVLYHSDGSYKKAVPDLLECGVDGFYCLEPSCGMFVVELKQKWPGAVWLGGVDGVDLMENGTPEQVRKEVHRHITETGALQNGGMFVASSSEINPPIPPENFKAMVDAVGEMTNPGFSL